MHSLLFWLSGFLPCRIIAIDGRPYLERYYLGSLLGRTFYLHRFVSGDTERHVHDHPWRKSIAFVLSGSYIEERLIGFDPATGWISRHIKRTWYRPNSISALDFHRIVQAKPNTWTLFSHSERIKGWGFLSQMEDEVHYSQPYNIEKTKNWFLTAPAGRNTATRVPKDAIPGMTLYEAQNRSD